MDFRKRSDSGLEVYSSVYSMVEATLCPKDPVTGLHKKACLNISCNECGSLEFSEKEMDNSGVVTWQTLEYVEIKTNKSVIKKLKLVTKQTAPCILVEHLKKHMFAKKFALHLFTSKWQREQW